jgi:hypothetical protein
MVVFEQSAPHLVTGAQSLPPVPVELVEVLVELVEMLELLAPADPPVLDELVEAAELALAPPTFPTRLIWPPQAQARQQAAPRNKDGRGPRRSSTAFPFSQSRAVRGYTDGGTILKITAHAPG